MAGAADLLSGLVGAGARVVLVEQRGVAATSDDDLFAVERLRLARAGARRRAEFGATRRCAREALAALGFAPAPIGADERGAPRWPDGVVGSLTHTEAYRACVVAPSGPLTGLGLDAEPARPVPAALEQRIVTPPERDHQDAMRARWPGVPWGRLLFAAKESIYKAWWPQERTRLGFRSGGIGFAVDTSTALSSSGTFVVTLYPPHLERQFHGRWGVTGGLVVALVADPWPGLPRRGWDERLSRAALAAA